MRIGTGKPLVFLLLTLFSVASACGGGSSTDWSVLPEDLGGGVVFYGDSRTGHDVHKELVDGMSTIAPSAVFHTGDLVANGLVPEQWMTFNSIVSRLPPGTPMYPAMGNHEYDSPYYFDNFELPNNERWYSVGDIEGYSFIVLDSGSDLSPASSQYQWLENELLAGVSSTEYTIVSFHYPLYSTGRHGSDEKGIRAVMAPLFEQYGVDAVFSGHDHDYERFTVNGVRYIVTGGGGAPLRDQDLGHADIGLSELYAGVHHFCVLYFSGDSALTVDVWSEEAELVDRFVIANR